MRTLSLKTLIVSAMTVILAMVAVAAVFVVDGRMHEALLMISAAFLTGIVLAAVAYGRVAEMLAAAGDFSRRIERGDFAARFATGTGGETAALAGALNRMVDRLRAAAETDATTSQRLSFLLFTSPDVIYAAKAGGDRGTTYISPNVRRQLGYAPEDFLGDPGFWLDNIHPEDRAGVLARLPDLFAGGHVETEYRFRHRDGTWRWMRDEATLVRDAAGEPLELVGSWTDITVRQELEMSLKQRDAILNAVAYGSMRFLRAGEMDSSAQWNLAVEAVLTRIGEATAVARIWVVENESTPAGDLVARTIHRWARTEFAVADTDTPFAGDMHYRREGLSVEALRLRRGELLRVRAQDLPAPVQVRMDRLGIHSQLLVPIAVGNDWWGFMAFDDCAGERSWPEIELEALRAAANLFGAGISARAGRDALRASLESLNSVLARLRRQSGEIERQNSELARANRMKSQFLAAITHELKTPLNGILGFADLLDAGLAGELSPQQRAYVGDILGAAQQLHGLVNRLLDLAQIDAGKQPLNPGETDLGILLRDVARAHEAAAHVRRITMTVEETGVVARLDARLVRHLLDELVDNAIKFNRDGGTVTLRASIDGEGQGARGNVILEVSDNGIGIAATDLPHLFEPFIQVDGALDRRYGGTGLGLALARRIAELHGGTIAVDSTMGQGSRFTVQFPQGPI